MGSRGVPNNRARFQLSRLNGFIASSNRLAENCRSPLTLGVALITVSSLTGYIACKWSPLKRLQKSDTENVSLNAMNSRKQYTYPMTKQRGCSPADIYNKCWKQSECRWPRRFFQESSTFPPTHKWQFYFDHISNRLNRNEWFLRRLTTDELFEHSCWNYHLNRNAQLPRTVHLYAWLWSWSRDPTAQSWRSWYRD